MTNNQIADLINFIIIALPILWRIFSSGRQNTPDSTNKRLANGYVATGKLDTDELRIYRERELMADRLLAETAQDLQRWRSFVDQRYWEQQAEMATFRRATEESIRHFEEFTRVVVRRMDQLQDCCDEKTSETQEMAAVNAPMKLVNEEGKAA